MKTRKLLWAVLAVGVMLIGAPLVIGLPDKADGGQKMIDAFQPIMEEDHVAATAAYYDDVFVPLGGVSPAMSQENIDRFNGYLAGFAAMGGESEQLVPTLAVAMGSSEDDVRAFMGEQFPAMSATIVGLPTMEQDFTQLLGLMDANVVIFEQVPAGLDHYEPLVRTMEAERENFDKVASLPDFRLFTWFFVVPGVVLVGLAAAGLVLDRPTRAADRERESTTVLAA